MRKFIRIGAKLAVICFVLTVSSCGTAPLEAPVSVVATLPSEPKAPAIQGTEEAAPAVETNDQTGKLIATAGDVAAGQVVNTINQNASLVEPYAKIVDLVQAKEADCLVVGEVIAVDFFDWDSIAFTTTTIEVDNAIRGKVEGKIMVRETGGYRLASDVAAENADKFPDRETQKFGSTDYVDIKFMGAKHPQIGDRVIMPLRIDPDSRNSKSITYVPVGAATGRLTISADGKTIKRAGSEHGWESETPTTQLAEILKVDQTVISG
jgi:hypothetical protein